MNIESHNEPQSWSNWEVKAVLAFAEPEIADGLALRCRRVPVRR